MTEGPGYYTDTTYTKGIYTGYDPRRISTIGRFSGLNTADTNQSFTYADFGCGFGVTLLMLAKMMPHGQFFGIDLMEEHVKEARRMAKALKLTNVTFINAGFGDVKPDDLPKLDFAVCHGVISWIGPVHRRELRQLVADRLNPNGIFAVSYNMQPGWSRVMPYREMFKAAVTQGTSVEKALELVRGLITQQSKAQGVNAQAAMRGFASGSIEYARHEFLNEYWDLFTNRFVADEMAEEGLGFAGPYNSPLGLMPEDKELWVNLVSGRFE